MARQIKNRREDLYINDVPPEIPDGIITDTDYATSTKAGVIKAQVSNGVQVAASGYLTAATRTAEQYDSAQSTLLLGKGTFENAVFPVVKAKIAADMGPIYEDAEVGYTWTVILRKTADGLVFDYAPTE